MAVITGQNAARVPGLIPYRHARMGASPFTFYRGAARIMAGDLASTPVTGLTFQICGDAHLSNFGSYASPERQQLFDINDFDETLPGPWEWDVKRLAASVVLASQDVGFSDDDARKCALAAVEGYRITMAELAGMRHIDVWYAKATREAILASVKDKKERARLAETADSYKRRDSLKAAAKLTEQVGEGIRIKSDPPFLVPLRDLVTDRGDEARAIVEASLAAFRASLPDDRHILFDSYRPVDIALKVVGVGSVGTRCFVVLMVGRDFDDPLFLQIKEATRSVLEEHLPPSKYANHGQRVVQGQRLMQAASDIFLGWSDAIPEYDFYWRQLKDMKGSADFAGVTPDRLERYARLCGRTLARAHARSGDSIAVAGYLGNKPVFDRAVADFSLAYAAQNQADYERFTDAIATGEIPASEA